MINNPSPRAGGRAIVLSRERTKLPYRSEYQWALLILMVMVDGCGTAMQAGNRCLRSQLGLTSEITMPAGLKVQLFLVRFQGLTK